MLTRLWLRLKFNAADKLNWFSLLSGLSLVLSYAPFSYWWLPFLVLPLWFSYLPALDVRSTTKQGFLFALGWFGSGLSWIHVSIDQFGGVPLIVSIVLMLLLVAYLAVFPALACYLSAKLSQYFRSNNRLILTLLPIFWFITDIARGVFLTGFPWLSLGYSQIDGPLSAFAPIIGEQGISLLVLFSAVAVSQIITTLKTKTKLNKNALIFLGFITIASFSVANIQWVTPKSENIKVALVQGNIDQNLKWLPENEWPNAMTYLDLTQQNFDADLVIWPESAITGLEPMQWVQDFLSIADQSASINNSAIVTGILNYNVDTKEYFNGLIVLGQYSARKTQLLGSNTTERNGISTQQNSHSALDTKGDYHYRTENRYYKNHLLPIGEFVPFQEWLAPLAPLFNLPMSSFSRGDYVQKNIQANGISLLPLICFEIAFPEQLAANLTDNTDAIITVSNDAWFGRSHGPNQHLDIARMRALEFGKPVIRATNTGITATIDHRGRVIAQIPQFEQQILRAEMSLTQGTTPYAQWFAIIPWLVVASSTLYILWLYFIKRLAYL